MSFTPASHVLNGTRNLSDAVRQRVLKAVQDLQYEPSGIKAPRRRAAGGSGP